MIDYKYKKERFRALPVLDAGEKKVSFGRSGRCQSPLRERELKQHNNLILYRPGVKIANSSHAPNSLSPIVLRAQFAAKIADMEVDASIERRELSVEDILNKCLAGQDLPWRFEKRTQ